MRTRGLLFLSIAALFLVVALAPAFAEVVNPPPWFDQADVRRHFTFNGTTPSEDTAPPFGHGYSAAMSYNTGVYLLTVGNNPDPMSRKDVWLQYTWQEDDDGGYIADPMNQNLHGSTGTWSPPDHVTEDLGGHSFRRTIRWTIFPQPANEWFEWWTGGGWTVTDVSVATICTVVPEPSSIAALLVSGLFTGAFALRRRRR